MQGWGELGMDTSVKPLHQPAMKLRIKDKEYEHGLGHHASGEIVVDLAGQFQTFQAEVGIQWQGGHDQASVIFRVLVDDKNVFDSGVMREGDAPRPIKISVAGVDELTLVADEAGDGITCDCANWADARLVPDPAAAKRPPVMGVDIAPFGHVATWDPQRMKGTAADRVSRNSRPKTCDCFVMSSRKPMARYRVPVQGDTGCIGLRWDENRLLRQVVLEFVECRGHALPASPFSCRPGPANQPGRALGNAVIVQPEQGGQSPGLELQPAQLIARHAEDPLGVLRCPGANRREGPACLLALPVGDT